MSEPAPTLARNQSHEVQPVPSLHGLMAEFSDHSALLKAAERAYAEGYRRMDAYSPFPIDGLAEAMGKRGTPIPLVVLLAGMAGGMGGYLMQWYALAVDYPLDIGGRPLHSWPAFVPITFELTVLSAALAAFLSVFILNRLPQPYHPAFNVAAFGQASQDRFFLCLEATDPKFNEAGTRAFLEELRPENVHEVAT
jgi:hypothetical protein